MILAWPALLGLLLASVRVRLRGASLQLPQLRALWLVYLAFIPQGIIFYAGGFADTPNALAAAVLIMSQFLLLCFVWLNREQAGAWLLGSGVGLNLLVITLNGGLMPVAPETLTQLAPHVPVEAWEIGARIDKDVVLPRPATQLWWLSDCLLLPSFLPYRVAFSIGDVLLALGAFQFTWSMGRPAERQRAPLISRKSHEHANHYASI
ncbi:MAG: DUF5317 domain-containing protein [Chloroflexota bacterium]|nr:DUF5317 domain-containing protein [Chloroflexota bacterium]